MQGNAQPYDYLDFIRVQHIAPQVGYPGAVILSISDPTKFQIVQGFILLTREIEGKRRFSHALRTIKPNHLKVEKQPSFVLDWSIGCSARHLREQLYNKVQEIEHKDLINYPLPNNPPETVNSSDIYGFLTNWLQRGDLEYIRSKLEIENWRAPFDYLIEINKEIWASNPYEDS